MKAQEAIKLSIDASSMITMGYLEDLTDADLLHRPAPACNHINWQLGHLIVAENHLLSKSVPGAMPPLPTGFEQKYTTETSKLDDPKVFAPKVELLRIYQQQRAASLAALAKTTEADLDKPSGVDFAPTVGAAISMAAGGHWLMHVGQWAVVRRQLGRPPLF